MLTLCCVMMVAGDMLRGVGGGVGLAPRVLHGAGGDRLAALAGEGADAVLREDGGGGQLQS